MKFTVVPLEGTFGCQGTWPTFVTLLVVEHDKKDIRNWRLTCVPCVTRHVGQAVRPPLTSILVGGRFNRIGVDVIQYARSRRGNRYAVVFMDYLTKWLEVFATSDQTVPTIARLLVEEIVSRHGVSGDLLSDRGPSFLSKLVLGTKKLNTTAYHLQTDGLVERFNRTLTDMLSKVVDQNGSDWDDQIPYVLFAYRTSLQKSTGESPFFLLHGRDACLPSEMTLEPWSCQHPYLWMTNKSFPVESMSAAWDLARKNIQQAQKR